VRHAKAVQFLQEDAQRTRRGVRVPFESRALRAEEATDAQYLAIPLFLAERAWAFAECHKRESSALATEGEAGSNKAFRHALARMRRAVKWAGELVRLCEAVADERTQLANSTDEVRAGASKGDGVRLLRRSSGVLPSRLAHTLTGWLQCPHHRGHQELAQDRRAGEPCLLPLEIQPRHVPSVSGGLPYAALAVTHLSLSALPCPSTPLPPLPRFNPPNTAAPERRKRLLPEPNPQEPGLGAPRGSGPEK
jgi:hypothetical protein